MSNQNDKEEGLVVIENVQADSQALYLQDKAQIDTMVATAHAFPRNIRRSTDNAIAIVSMDRDTASSCTYAVPRGGKTISGPSVHMAKILSQTWGNMRVEAKVIEVGQSHVTSQAVAFDLENNLAIKVEVKRSIMGRQGRFNDDMIVVTGNAANSIALRNAVLSVIPKAVVDKVYNAAKQTITGDISDNNKLIAKRKQVFDALKDTYGVSEKDVLGAVGKAAIDHITADDLVVIIGFGQAIKDGDTTVEEAFRKKAADVETKTDPHLLDTWRETLAQCKTIDEVDKLKKQNKPTDKTVLALFEDRKKELESTDGKLPL